MSERTEAEGREVGSILDPEQEGTDVEDLMSDIQGRGERTDRMRR